MRNNLWVVLTLSMCATCFAASPAYKKQVISDKFYAEGAYYGDFNKDGKPDIVAGPYWYEGPDFQKRHEIYPGKEYDPKGYSEVFVTFVADFNGDGWPDVLHCPHPGKEAYWYENPAGKDGPWKKHLAVKDCGNESQCWGDVNGDGRPELIYNINGFLGYATWDPAKPDAEWVFHPVSTKGSYQRYTHGCGFGDINGDGRVDILEANGWWEQPAAPKEGEPWIRHPFKFSDAAAQMLVYDIDGDGLNDVVTAWHCHLFGLVWWQQVRDAKGEISFTKHEIIPEKPDPQKGDLRVSQLHAFDLVDINGDGLKDFVTGKRFWAHGPRGDVEPDAPAVVYWFELKRDKEKGASFIPHQIDNDSGVGTQVAAADVNGDGVPDVIVANKKGVFVHLSQPKK